MIDAANLRTLVRTLRMGKGADFLRERCSSRAADVARDGIC